MREWAAVAGGGAEIFAERARPLIAGHKISGARWLEVARAVHRHGHAFECDDVVTATLRRWKSGSITCFD